MNHQRVNHLIHETKPQATALAAPLELAPALPDRIRLSLLGGFELSDGGEPVVLRKSTRRLLTFVALQGRRVSRDVVAEALWPEVPPAQSHGSLRSAIWRLEQPARYALTTESLGLGLSPDVALDFGAATALAHRILSADPLPSEADMTPAAIAALSSDLLPDWYDDWASNRAEDWRQLRLRALEALARKLLDAERYSDAVEAVSEAKNADPLRESPRALLIRIHLAEGNQSEAMKEFLSYRELLREDLGIEPTPRLRELMCGLMA